MRLDFLGGAESIGASCNVLEIGGRRWIVDCGIRVKGSGEEKLPDLGRLETLGPPSAILLTHAHLDHIGGLPVLHQRYPLTPVYATPPTIALTRIQLFDSLRIMEEEATVEQELPLYSQAAVESLLAKMIPVTPLRPFRPDLEGPEVTFFPAGHIIGACSIGISSEEGNVLVSGDISVDNQRTIPGMRPPRFRADVAIFESTYGNRLHPKRSAEEARLVETVAETIAGGGKVLIPAFAIGRAQEVLLVLLRAQLTKAIPPFPIWADGMVRRTCGIYAAHPWYLQSTLRRRIEKHGDPFFGPLETVRPVRQSEDRQAILGGEPAVVVSSSGMLTGGPSPLYAAGFADNPRNLIAITGYQDEEAPGRQLQDAARGDRETITLEGKEIAPRCRITTYALSGHASGAQIAALAGSVRASDVLLVHGDRRARVDLGELLIRERRGRIHLPSHGESIEGLGRQRGRGGPAATGAPSPSSRRLRVTGVCDVRPDAPFPAEALEALADHVREIYPEGAAFTADELHNMATGSPQPDEDRAASFEALLRESTCFAHHPQRLFHFTAVAAGDRRADEEVDGVLAVEALFERIDAALPADAGLLRKSYQPGEQHLTLVFAFPDVANARYRTSLEEVFRDSGWTFDVHPLPNPSEVDRLIREHIPDANLLAKNPSLRIEERTAVVPIRRPLGDDEVAAWNRAAGAIGAETGFRVVFKVLDKTPAARESRDAQGRLEINLAYRAIETAFEDEPHQPYKLGKKPGAPGEEPFIEVAFISPAVAARYRGLLDRIEGDIGWRIQLSRVPNMNAILGVARALLEGYSVRRGPSFHAASGTIRIALETSLPDEERERIAASLREATGFDLETRTN